MRVFLRRPRWTAGEEVRQGVGEYSLAGPRRLAALGMARRRRNVAECRGLLFGPGSRIIIIRVFAEQPLSHAANRR